MSFLSRTYFHLSDIMSTIYSVAIPESTNLYENSSNYTLYISTSDRTDFSSERVPHRDMTATFRQHPSDRK
jgi:hypothetical protein